MRIGIDIQTAVNRPTGVGRHVITLIRGLAALPGGERFRLFCFDFRRRFAGPSIDDPRFELRRIRLVPGALYNFVSERTGLPDISRLAGCCDLYHFPNFIIHPLRKGKAVVTVHDLSFARFPEHADARNLSRLKRRFAYSLERADAIITVSEFSRRELMELYGVKGERVTVIHNGISVPAGEDRRRRFDFDYFLFVGTIEPRKNLETLLEAWRIIKFRRGAAWGCKLVIVGGTGWGCAPPSRQARDKGVEEDVVILDYMPNEALPSLYANAEALVYPSLYEGFGLPPLEAMARGTPVISSNAPALPEILGEAALLCDPIDPEDFARAMVRIRDDHGLREALVAKGRERAGLFSAERMARETLALYRKLLY